MSSLTLLLPYPPSLNTMFRNVPGKGRVPTKRYEEWKAESGDWLLTKQGKLYGPCARPTIAVPFTLTTRLNPPDKRRRDLDNVGAKAILDRLKAWNIVADDSLASEIRMLWDTTNVTPGAALIELEWTDDSS